MSYHLQYTLTNFFSFTIRTELWRNNIGGRKVTNLKKPPIYQSPNHFTYTAGVRNGLISFLVYFK